MTKVHVEGLACGDRFADGRADSASAALYAVGRMTRLDRENPVVDLSVVAPAHNEAENIERLVQEIGAALAPTGLAFEFVLVDDGSTDRTREIVQGLMADRPWLRCVAMRQTPPGKGNGQSAAFHAGFRAASGELVAVLDADLQNDPAEIPAMIELLRRSRADMVQGDRSHARQDNAVRKAGSWVGRMFRRMVLGDTIRDTGCSLRLFKREIGLKLPLEFKGMHRFIPATARHLGYTVVEMPVKHRARTAGTTKYGFGIVQRGLPGLIDLFGVRYMRNRRRPVEATEIVEVRAGSGAATKGASAERVANVQAVGGTH